MRIKSKAVVAGGLLSLVGLAAGPVRAQGDKGMTAPSPAATDASTPANSTDFPDAATSPSTGLPATQSPATDMNASLNNDNAGTFVSYSWFGNKLKYKDATGAERVVKLKDGVKITRGGQPAAPGDLTKGDSISIEDPNLQ
jgi:hypothetical protein